MRACGSLEPMQQGLASGHRDADMGILGRELARGKQHQGLVQGEGKALGQSRPLAGGRARPEGVAAVGETLTSCLAPILPTPPPSFFTFYPQSLLDHGISLLCLNCYTTGIKKSSVNTD